MPGDLGVELDGCHFGVALEERRGDGAQARTELHDASPSRARIFHRAHDSGDDALVLEEVLAQGLLLGDREVALRRDDGEAVALIVALPAILPAAFLAIHESRGVGRAVIR